MRCSAKRPHLVRLGLNLHIGREGHGRNLRQQGSAASRVSGKGAETSSKHRPPRRESNSDLLREKANEPILEFEVPKIGRPPRLLYHDVLSLYQLHPSYDRSVPHLLQGFGTVCYCVREGGSWNRTKEGQFGVMLKSGLYFILASIVKVMGVPVG